MNIRFAQLESDTREQELAIIKSSVTNIQQGEKLTNILTGKVCLELYLKAETRIF
jgi:hypothetical protein